MQLRIKIYKIDSKIQVQQIEYIPAQLVPESVPGSSWKGPSKSPAESHFQRWGY